MDNGEHRRRGQRWPARGTLLAAALVLVPAASAAAQVPTVPGVTLPTPIGSAPVAPETGGTAPPTPTTVAATPPAGVTTPPPTTNTRPTTQRSGTRRAPAAPMPAPPTTVPAVAPVLAADDEQATAPAGAGAAVPTARELGFPLALAALVSAFVAVQGRLDRRDPKLAAAPISIDDDLLGFE